MIKIVHILQSFGVGGMESRVARLARGLTDRGFEIHILTLRPSTERQPALPSSVKMSLFEIKSGIWPGKIWSLSRFIKANGFDIVHTHNWSTMLYGVLAGKLANAPIIIHGEHGLNHKDLTGLSWKRIVAQRRLAALCDQIIPIHQQMSEGLIASWHLNPNKVTPIPNGVDLSKFRLRPQTGNKEFVVGTVGRLDKVKNLPCLIKAVALLRALSQEKLGVRLVLVGEGPERANLEKLVDELEMGDITNFVGDVTDPESWYEKFSVYVNCSHFEGMSNTLLEAMASELPLVVSNIPGNTSWVSENENALYFVSDQEKDLSHRLQFLKENRELSQSIGKRNGERAKLEFDNRFFLDKYERLYHHLIDG